MRLALLKISFFSVAVGFVIYYFAQPIDFDRQEGKINVELTNFNSAVSSTGERVLFGRSAKAQKSISETTLNVILKGVMTSSISEQAMAILLIDGREEKVVFVTEEISSGVTLHEVKDSYVVINRQGDLEKLSFAGDEQKALIEVQRNLTTDTEREKDLTRDLVPYEPPHPALVKEESKGILGHLKSGLTSIALNQIEKELHTNGEETLRKHGITAAPNGYTVTRQNAMLEAAGVKIGDTIISVNGMPVASLMNNQQAIESIKQQGKAAILIKRNNQTTTLNYTF